MLIDEFCGTRGNFLVLCDGAKHEDIYFIFARFCFGGQRHTELEREYFKGYQAVDERLPRIRKLPDSELAPVHALFSKEEMSTSVIYNKLLPRIDMRDGLTVRLDGPRGSCCTSAPSAKMRRVSPRASLARSCWWSILTTEQTSIWREWEQFLV